jgi:hypothetical protein
MLDRLKGGAQARSLEHVDQSRWTEYSIAHEILSETAPGANTIFRVEGIEVGSMHGKRADMSE